ncbi:cathepsin D [Malassezia nana]|uniref:Cathepsin D n=1 Tax=Malassezia nana TaxID=180528 RepID=A0AAF0ENM6_9BASI|nr:cathepsin D [Malassezia nana]
MQLSLKFVIGLVASAAFASASQQEGIVVDLTRRSDSPQYSEFNVQRTQNHLMGINAKYYKALENYHKNTGKEHPLKKSSLDKRWTATIDLVDINSEVEWAGQLRYGTPLQSFYVDFDTGSSDTLVNPSAYDPKKSSTSNNTHTTFSAAYGDGTKAEGPVYTDVFQVGSIKAKNVAIGRSKKTFIESSESPNQGIAGLALPSIQTFDSKYKPFFTELVSQKAIPRGVFQFTLKPGQGSTLQLGFIDKSKFTGDLSWVDYNPVLGFYLTTATLNNRKILAIIDSGTTLIIGPAGQVRSVLQKLPNVTMFTHKGSLYGRYPCNKPPKVTINVAGKDFTLGKEQTSYGKSQNECVLSVVGQEGLPLNAWIVGDVFFQMASIVFDQDKNRMGFATQA